MDTVKQLRLTYIHHGLRESNKRLKEALNASDPNSLPITTSLSEVIFWLNVADEWHFRNRNTKGSYTKLRKKEIGGQCLLGLRHAFNSLKHEMSFIKLIRSVENKPLFEGSGYVVEDYSKEIIWLKAKGLIDKRKNEDKLNLKNYRRYLEGKNVPKTIEEATRFLYERFTETKTEHFQNNKFTVSS
ncbi:hypothetical protein [Bacillus sp. OK048]|uniref:hypothetical protein n=1 Tax=Bacillus sp. OK048 TaxID=1882761 RepID=UPI0008924683|nr:hypothetical protein [Bacillus sp. OK048]SDM23128.1 hypothetical protein SAMN05443253_102388 [Bacillus sp. OK048]